METMVKKALDEVSYFGDYGGQYVPDTLFALSQLETVYKSLKKTRRLSQNFPRYYLIMWVVPPLVLCVYTFKKE